MRVNIGMLPALVSRTHTNTCVYWYVLTVRFYPAPPTPAAGAAACCCLLLMCLPFTFQLLDKLWSQVSSLLPPGIHVAPIFIAQRVQHSHCLSISVECC